MPESGIDRGRNSTRTLIATILAGTEWTPAANPQDATLTAREARDLAVRLRPVLSKLAQQPRTGRRRDLDWLPAVEQLAVDAQYFASWWLPRLDGKSAQSWPSWSADGYADWVKRLDAQRERTLEMVRGTAPITKIVSVTPLASAADEVRPKSPSGPDDVGVVDGEERPLRPQPAARHRDDVAADKPPAARPAPRLAAVERPDGRSSSERPASRAAGPPVAKAADRPAPAPKPSAMGGSSRDTAAAPTAGAFPPPRKQSSSESADVGRIVRYSLSAVLFFAGCVLVLIAVTKHASTGKVAAPVSPAPIATTASSAPKPSAGTASSSVAVPTTATTIATITAAATPSTAVESSAGPSQAPPPVTRPATTRPAGPGGITAITATVAFDQSGSPSATAHLHITTNGTGTVTVIVVAAGSGVSGTPGSVHPFTTRLTMSGQTHYDEAVPLDGHQFCPAAYLGVEAAPDPSATAGARNDYADTTSYCA